MGVVPDLICHTHRQPGTRGKRGRVSILLIPGNPGLIAYYADFLQHLDSLLQTSTRCPADDAEIEIVGRSLGGFEAANPPNRAPLGLYQQVDFVEAFIRSLDAEDDDAEQRRIILIGHSVGAFILLEILQRFACQEDQHAHPLIGGICLFPTVVDIAKSKSGRRFGWLLQVPFFLFWIVLLAKILVFLLPRSSLHTIIRSWTTFPEDAASTTLAFLESPTGVRQALHMARDEMREITRDRWDETIWGSSGVSPAKLFFYFGKSDHWVADCTRDDLIARRARRDGEHAEWKPRMEVDSSGIPHSFSIHHSSSVAQTCASYVEKIVLESNLNCR